MATYFGVIGSDAEGETTRVVEYYKKKRRRNVNEL